MMSSENKSVIEMLNISVIITFYSTHEKPIHPIAPERISAHIAGYELLAGK